MKKLACLLTFAFLVTGCNSSSKDFTDSLNRSYDNYSEFYITDIKESMYTQKEDKYIVYIFRRACSSCIDIKGALLDYLDSYKVNTLTYKLYLYEWNLKSDIYAGDLQYFKGSLYYEETKEIERLILTTIGVSTTEETYIYGTPALYFVENNKLVKYIYSTNDIGEWLYSNK